MRWRGLSNWHGRVRLRRSGSGVRWEYSLADSFIWAYVDESGSSQRVDPGAYLVGAALVSSHEAEDVCREFAALRRRGQVKLHWRDESDATRRRVLETLLGLPVEALLAVHVAVDRTQESRRHRTMKALLPALAELGVTHVDVESRGPKDDQRDRTLLDGLRRSRVLTGESLRMDHQPGPEIPGLWIADAVCGAVVSQRLGNAEYVEMLGARLRIIEAP